MTKEKKVQSTTINSNCYPLIRSLNFIRPISQFIFFLFLSLPFQSLPSSSSSSSSDRKFKDPPPLPILPIPSAFQLRWQLDDMAIFLHFGTNTFTDSEWGSGRADPSVFNPTQLDAAQWVRVAKDSGFKRLVLTAKHHDGFCLWPTEYTDYSVRSSPWRNGSGDIVGELAQAARDAGIGLGIYLSPWDRHEPCYGETLDYNEFYIGQMTELLTKYGDIREVFLDGAKGENEKDMEYFFDSWFSLIHQLQPGAVIFTDAGPDVRWIGDEAGIAGSTCWSLFNRSYVTIGGYDTEYLIRGDPVGHDWVPAECDVSIRPGWFWHPSEVPKSASTLLDIYYKSAGRNCQLLLNVPPNSSGLISAEDIQVLKEFNELKKSIFSLNLAANALLTASSTRGRLQDSRFDPYNVLKEGIYTYWAPEENQYEWVLYLNLTKVVSFNVLRVQEPIHMGQRVMEFHLEILNANDEWKKVINGTTVGYQRLLRFPTVKSQHLRFVIDESRADPLISNLGIYMDEFSIFSNIVYNNTRRHTHLNGSQYLRHIPFNHSQVATM
ncbi:alpha-L-fucosidase 1 isoform X1 [Ziziphus jujuba]|uniref:alpha-L-fucosidase n=1 Tax=Ziziphus jujuba TaxID=326968 RepID=A0ABM3IA71_ZIZJJ|nr:alpha-L-fucosidase 1 isoform X1 [Ziziphus jujuba]